jgi:seryl-tRNA synthetase
LGEIVNLRQARKSQQKRRDELQAEQNRISFGLSKAEKRLAEKARAQATRNLDGHLRESGESPADPDKTCP